MADPNCIHCWHKGCERGGGADPRRWVSQITLCFGAALEVHGRAELESGAVACGGLQGRAVGETGTCSAAWLTLESRTRQWQRWSLGCQ